MIKIKSAMTAASITRIIVLCTLSACAVGPDFKRPQAPTADSFTRGASRPASSVSVSAQWWQVYESKELEHLIELALKHNPNVQAASANLRVAQQNTIAQQGFYFPSISLGGTRTIQNNGGSSSGPSVNGVSALGVGAPSYSVNNAGLSVGFVPDIFGANKRAVESLKGLENNARYQLAAFQITIATTVIQTALQELTLREELELVIAGERAAYKQLEHLRRMNAIGYSSGIDLALQEAQYAQAAAQVPAVQKLHDQTLDMLSVLCGELPNANLALPSIGGIKIPANLPSAVPSAWINTRPDVRAAEEMVRSSNAQIGVALANMIPQISIAGFTGATAGAFSALKDSFNKSWSETLSVNQTVFAGGTLLARKRAAEENLQATLALYKAAVLTAFQNVADTLYACEQDKNNLDIAVHSEEANKKILDYTKTQYDKGYASEPMLLSAQQNYLAAQIVRIQAYALYLGDTAALYQSLGGGWKQEGSDSKL